MEARKAEEIEFHNRLRDESLKADPKAYRALTANKKYYAVADGSQDYYRDWLRRECPGKRVLDFGCGGGVYTNFLAECGASHVGAIDISDVSVANAQRAADAAGYGDRVKCEVMDCEALTYPDNSFDIVSEAGVLHHIDLPKAMAEMARVLAPDGKAICYEAVGHNPLFQAYRNMTPVLRTKYETEHILKMKDIGIVRRNFERVDIKFFHLAVLAAVPFRKWPGFPLLLRGLEAIDEVLLKIPGIREQAWMMIFVMSGPKKTRR